MALHGSVAASEAASVRLDERADLVLQALAQSACLSCDARQKSVCGALPNDLLNELARHSTRRTFQRDQELVAAGSPNDVFANILSGVVKLVRPLADGRSQIVGLQFAPDFLGRPFAVENEIAAEAATEVSVCIFPRSILEEMMLRVPEMEHRLHAQNLKELDEAREWMVTLGRKTAPEKVASFLYLIGTHVDPEIGESLGPVTFELPLRRADIADFLGLTIETVSRQLTRLRKEGVIVVVNNRMVTIPHLPRLRAVAEQDLSR